MFTHEQTREILWDIYAFCGVYQANGGKDEYERGIREGKRRVGLYLETLFAVIETKDIVKWKHEMARLEGQVKKALESDRS